MHAPDLVAKLQRVDDAKGIAPERERDLEDAEPKPRMGLASRLTAFRRNRERREADHLRPFGEFLEFLQRGFDP